MRDAARVSALESADASRCCDNRGFTKPFENRVKSATPCVLEALRAMWLSVMVS